jgi:hypothetical protein
VLAMEAMRGGAGGERRDPFAVQPIQDRFPETIATR